MNLQTSPPSLLLAFPAKEAVSKPIPLECKVTSITFPPSLALALAHLAFCAAAILARPAAVIVRPAFPTLPPSDFCLTDVNLSAKSIGLNVAVIGGRGAPGSKNPANQDEIQCLRIHSGSVVARSDSLEQRCPMLKARSFIVDA